MFSLHFNLCNPAINNRGVSVGKWKLFARSREDIADIRKLLHHCVHFLYINAKKFSSWNIFRVQFRTRCETSNSHLTTFIISNLHVYSGQYNSGNIEWLYIALCRGVMGNSPPSDLEIFLGWGFCTHLPFLGILSVIVFPNASLLSAVYGFKIINETM